MKNSTLGYWTTGWRLGCDVVVALNDLMRHGDQFPLGAPLGSRGNTADEDIVVPFGLRYAEPTPPSARVDVDFSKISYDPVRQIAVVVDGDGGVLSAMRHTSTQTSTDTASRDRDGPDRDTDATGT
jgi:putative ATP-grasp target RiPP